MLLPWGQGCVPVVHCYILSARSGPGSYYTQKICAEQWICCLRGQAKWVPFPSLLFILYPLHYVASQEYQINRGGNRNLWSVYLKHIAGYRLMRCHLVCSWYLICVQSKSMISFLRLGSRISDLKLFCNKGNIFFLSQVPSPKGTFYSLYLFVEQKD